MNDSKKACSEQFKLEPAPKLSSWSRHCGRSFAVAWVKLWLSRLLGIIFPRKKSEVMAVQAFG